MTDLRLIKQRLPETLILEFLDANEDCTIDLVMLVELGVYTRKDTAVKALKREGFEEGLDYSVLKRRASTTGISAVEVDDYLLTSDAFKELCMIADTSTGKLVRKYYIEVERRWKREQKEKIGSLESVNENPDKEIERLIDELITLAFEVCWESADFVNNIHIRTAQEQKRLQAAFENRVDRRLLYSIAKDALTNVDHSVIHQHTHITGIAEERLEPYKEYALAKFKEWQVLQGSVQPVLPPVEEFPVPRTATERRQSVIAKLFDLVAEYGSLDAIPRRKKGRPSANPETDWGSAKLSQMFGVSQNTILAIWDEVDEEIKQHGFNQAKRRLLG